jgi:hypothetical protein
MNTKFVTGDIHKAILLGLGEQQCCWLSHYVSSWKDIHGLNSQWGFFN